MDSGDISSDNEMKQTVTKTEVVTTTDDEPRREELRGAIFNFFEQIQESVKNLPLDGQLEALKELMEVLIDVRSRYRTESLIPSHERRREESKELNINVLQTILDTMKELSQPGKIEATKLISKVLMDVASRHKAVDCPIPSQEV